MDPSFQFKSHFKRNLKLEERHSIPRSSLNLSSSLILREKNGKTAVVTYCHWQLQASIAIKLCKVGYTVFAFYDEKLLTKESKSIFEEKYDKKIITVKYDPLDSSSLDLAYNQACSLGLSSIDVLILGPYVYFTQSSDFESSITTTKVDFFNECLQNITLPSLYVFQKFFNLVVNTKGSKILFLSNRLSSITENSSGKAYSSRASFAGINQIVKSLSCELSGKVLVSVGLPGMILTGTNTQNSNAEPSFIGAERVYNILEFMTPENSGKLIEHTLQIIDP